MTATQAGPAPVDRGRVSAMLAAERRRFASAHPRAMEFRDRAGSSLLYGVPMNWMTRWASPAPVVVASANGAQVQDIDGHTYADLCLGDTGAMAGHSPPAVAAAVTRQMARGATAMLPTEDAVWAAEEMSRRFGLARWQFCLTATDANRFVLRLARQVTGRRVVVVHNWCYHGSVDESVAVLDEAGRVVHRPGSVGPAIRDISETTRVVEINDLRGLERALADHAVACVLAEPALTNIGIVLPDPGYHDELRRMTSETGTLLAIDETHTICAGPGGYTGREGLRPDFLTIGKSIGGGVPVAAYGMTAEVGDRVVAGTHWQEADVGGVGGTLAGNPLSLAAVRATLGEVLTAPAFASMESLAERFADGVGSLIARHCLPWHITRLGCRAEYLFGQVPPRTGADAAAAGDAELDALIHLAMLNRGILLTPFHNMALMSPATTAAQVDRHHAALDEVVTALVA